MRKIYPLFVLSLFSFFLQAQELTIKGLVVVQSDALLYVEGDVLIDEDGVLDIQSNGADHGQVQVQVAAANSPGEWTCDGVTQSSVGGEGEVHFLGDEVDYNIQGSSVTFPNLIVNHGIVTAGVNGAETNILDNIEIERSLDLASSRLITAPGVEVYVSNSSENAITSSGDGFGANYSNYVEGSLKREIAIGNYYKYPIGCTPDALSGIRGYNPGFLDFRGADARIPANATSIVGRFDYIDEPGTIHHNQLAHSCYSTSTGYQFLELHWMIKRFGYWDFLPNGNPQGWDYDFYVKPDIDRIFAQNTDLTHMKIIKAPRTFTVNATADWSDYVEESGDGCDMVSVYNNEIYWKPGPNTSTFPYDLTDSIRASGLITFSRFGLSGGTGAGLPIDWLFIEAHPVYQQPIENSYISVNWGTATEINNSGFEVYRGTDGMNVENFEYLGWRDGAGNSSTNLYYNYDDKDVVPNQRYYYYVRQVDYDGTADTSDVVSAIISAPSTFVISEFIPNPAQNNSWLNITTSDERDINVTVYNTLGQIMNTVDHHLVQGNNRIDFDFNLLADGTYFAIILSDNQVFNRKLILTK